MSAFSNPDPLYFREDHLQLGFKHGFILVHPDFSIPTPRKPVGHQIEMNFVQWLQFYNLRML